MSAQPQADPLTRAVEAPYDEAFSTPGVPREHYAALLTAVAAADVEELRRIAVAHVAKAGATFGSGHDAEPFKVDPVPRLMPGREWDALAAGVDQRVRALNAFVIDAYGPREIVAAGVMADRVIEQAEGYEPALRGRLWPGVLPIAIAGLDVVRDPAGTLMVLEDNCRAPSGYAYALAVRAATEAVLPLPTVGRREIAGPVRELLGGVLRDAVPAGVEEPVVVVLTDGPHNVAYWEHAYLAELTGSALVTFDELEQRDGRLFVRRPDGASAQVDVLYRRCDEDRMRGDDGAPTLLAELLAEPWTAGTLGLVNGLGAGVADDKLVHSYVEAMVRFYLHEEPLLASLPTYDLGDPSALAMVLADLEDFVVKPRGGYGGHGVVVCGHANAITLAELRADLARAPEGFIAQHTVSLSSVPTIVDGGELAPRHVDLRPFTFSGRGWTRTLPGGLTRVALEEGTLVVNSSQEGGAKDTWVLT